MPRFIPHPKTNVDKVQNINMAIKMLKDRLNVDLTCVNTSRKSKTTHNYIIRSF